MVAGKLERWCVCVRYRGAVGLSPMGPLSLAPL